MITLRAPQRTEPKRSPDARPDLRVIETPAPLVAPDVRRRRGTEDERDPRRSHGGLVGTLFVVLLFVCIFGVVVFQVFLVQTQSHLDDLGTKISHEENRTKALRLDTTDLESPDRIVKDARDRLGMIPPPEIAYLQPGADDDTAGAFDPAKETVPTTATTVAPATPATPKVTTPKAPSSSTATTTKPTATTVKPTATTAKPKTTTTSTTKPKSTTTTAKPTTSTPPTTTKAAPGR